MEAHKCIPCEKIFHPSCLKLHKIQNREKETIYCKGAVEIYLVKTNAKVGVEAASGSGKEVKAAKRETCEITIVY